MKTPVPFQSRASRRADSIGHFYKPGSASFCSFRFALRSSRPVFPRPRLPCIRRVESIRTPEVSASSYDKAAATTMSDAYAVLNVPRSAGRTEIQKAYKAAVRNPSTPLLSSLTESNACSGPEASSRSAAQILRITFTANAQ